MRNQLPARQRVVPAMVIATRQAFAPGAEPTSARSYMMALRGLGADPLTPNDYMDGVVSELKRGLLLAAGKVLVNPDEIARVLAGPVGLLISPSAGESAARANLQRDVDYIKKLDGELRQQVLNGRRADGSPYTLDTWKSFAKDIASDIQLQAGSAWSSSAVEAAMGATVQTAEDVASGLKKAADTAAHPLQWPWWAWLAVLAGVAVVAAPYVGPPLKLWFAEKQAKLNSPAPLAGAHTRRRRRRRS